jgi:Uma2 family endonuclease
MTMFMEQTEVPHRKRWTRQECQQLRDAGFLPGRYELIDGEILEKMPKKPPHVIALMLLAAWMEGLFGRYFVRTQDPVVIPVPDEFSSEPEPDIAVTRAPTTAYLTNNPGPEDLLLVGEVSDSTLAYDLRIKANLYGAAGIPEYWVLDVAGRRLNVHRLPSPEGYREVRLYTENEQVATLSRPDDPILVASLLPPTERE